MCSGCAGPCNAFDSNFHAKPNQPRRRREVFEHSYILKDFQDPCIRSILLNLLELAKSWIGFMRDLHLTDPKEMELQNELYDEWKKALRQYWFSLDSKNAGGQEQWSVNGSKCGKPTCRWPDALWTSVQFTIWWANHFFWSRCKILSNVYKTPRTTASVRYRSPFLNIHGIP